MITKTEFAFFIITLKKLKDVRKHLQDLNSGIFNFLMLIAQKKSRFFFLSSLFFGFKCFFFFSWKRGEGGEGREGGREGGRGGREVGWHIYMFYQHQTFAFIQDDMLLVLTFWLRSH